MTTNITRAALDEIERLRADNARLREALEPLAKIYSEAAGGMFLLSSKDFKAAHDALEGGA